MVNLKDYVDVLRKHDRTYINENRRYDSNRGAYYEQGISVELEEQSKEKVFNDLLGRDNLVYEEPYERLSSKWSGKRGKKTCADIHKPNYWILNSNNSRVRQQVAEFKKLHKVNNNGSLDEYTNKKLSNDNPALSPYNPFTGKSEYSCSVIGDIEKLLTLPNTIDRYMILEYWTNKEHYPADRDLKNLDNTINDYYNVEKDSIEYTDSIHPIHTICHIIIYKILSKK